MLRCAPVLALVVLAACAVPGEIAPAPVAFDAFVDVPAPDTAAPEPSVDVPEPPPPEPDVSARVDTGPVLPIVVLESGPFEIAAGETLSCTYTELVPETDLAVAWVQGTQAKYGHHVNLTFIREDLQPPHHGPCPTGNMTELHLVAPATVGGPYKLPAGKALRIPAGAQVVLQSHYIDTSGGAAPIVGNDSVTLATYAPGEVTDFVDNLQVNDEGVLIPAATGSWTRVTTCTLEADFSIFQMRGHMHEHGTHYTLDRLDDAGEVAETLIDLAWSPAMEFEAEARVWDVHAPYVLPAGTRLRQTCVWSNPKGPTIAYPTEMCMAAMLYFPGTGDVTCSSVP